MTGLVIGGGALAVHLGAALYLLGSPWVAVIRLVRAAARSLKICILLMENIFDGTRVFAVRALRKLLHIYG